MISAWDLEALTLLHIDRTKELLLLSENNHTKKPNTLYAEDHSMASGHQWLAMTSFQQSTLLRCRRQHRHDVMAEWKPDTTAEYIVGFIIL